MINIDNVNFTPFSSLTGGILIGVGVIIFFISTGRLAGVSGLMNKVLTSKDYRILNSLFLFGLILGPLIYIIFAKSPIPFKINSSIPIIILGGLLVSIGTKIGSGCTSGHGVCGISQFSIRSIVATFLFILSGITTVFIFRILGIN